VSNVKLEVPEKLIPVFAAKDVDVRGVKGGRGSAKTRTFAKMSAVMAYKWSKAGIEGIILCGRQYMNSLDESSMEEVKVAIRSEPWLEEHFEIGEKIIRTKCGRISYKFSGLTRNVDSVKSKSRILLCWVDEAENVTETAWQKLIPSLRAEGEDFHSELWVTWNPESKRSATHQRFWVNRDERMVVVEMNWSDNEFFPDILNRIRLKDKKERPESYNHVWEGGFITAHEGAYFSAHLQTAKEEGRIGNVSADPLMRYRAYWDIGGTGSRADNTVIWVAQFIGREIRVLDHYEAQGQPLATHINWLREKGYSKALCILPHDGATHDKVFDVSYESSLEAAGFDVEVVPNQGRGAAKMRVEALRRLFPSIWFNDKTTEGGREAIAWYHEKKDEDRQIGLGPNHDWSSHSADALGLLAVHYEAPNLHQDIDEVDTDWIV